MENFFNLYRLDYPNEDLYIEYDFKKFSKILFDINSIYKSNDPYYLEYIVE